VVAIVGLYIDVDCCHGAVALFFVSSRNCQPHVNFAIISVIEN
jgi:hypothetical protein